MVTNINELKSRKYIEVELPGWDIDDKFICKLKRVSLFDLASKGKIPNPLMGKVSEVFKSTYTADFESEAGLKEMNDLCNFFAEVCLVEPTFAEVEEAIGLTDEQKMHLYFFAIQGVKAIEPFLRKQRSNECNLHDGDVSKES